MGRPEFAGVRDTQAQAAAATWIAPDLERSEECAGLVFELDRRVTIEADTCRINLANGVTVTAPRRSNRDIRQHKASHYAAQVGHDDRC